MPMTKDQLLAEAMSLDPDEREALAEQLLLTLTDADQAAVDAAWLKEARRREAAFQNGEMTSAPVDEVIARLTAGAKR